MEVMGAGRLRRVPTLFCSGAGQQTVSQDARAALAEKEKKKYGRRWESSRGSCSSAIKHRRVVLTDEEDVEHDAKDEEEEEYVHVPTPATQATQADAFEDDDAHDEALLSCSVDEPAQFPGQLRTGSKAFIEWYIERFTASADTFTDDAQTIIMLEMGTPHDIRSAITGHVVSLAPEKRDKNQRGYQEQLAMDVRNQLKCAYIMPDAGREMAPDQKRFNWPDDVPEALVAVIRETLPKRLRQCDLDLPRLPRVRADCIRELNNSNTAASKVIGMTNGRLDPVPAANPARGRRRRLAAASC